MQGAKLKVIRLNRNTDNEISKAINEIACHFSKTSSFRNLFCDLIYSSIGKLGQRQPMELTDSLCHDELRRRKINDLILPRKVQAYRPNEYADT